jgi:hypothetical protein
MIDESPPASPLELENNAESHIQLENAVEDELSPPIDSENANDYEFELAELNQEVASIINSETSLQLVSAILLVMFFECKLSQESFKKQTKFIQLFTSVSIPKSINTCIHTLTSNNMGIDSVKSYFCNNCKLPHQLDYSKNRNCPICNAR